MGANLPYCHTSNTKAWFCSSPWYAVQPVAVLLLAPQAAIQESLRATKELAAFKGSVQRLTAVNRKIAQPGSPLHVAKPSALVKKLWCSIAKSLDQKFAASLVPENSSPETAVAVSRYGDGEPPAVWMINHVVVFQALWKVASCFSFDIAHTWLCFSFSIC